MTARIVILGGGITGLSAAHRLVAVKRDRNLDLEITLVEAQSRVGGVIKSEAQGDYCVEHGPDSFLMEKPVMSDLCAELDLEKYIDRPAKMNGRAFVVSNGRLHPLPQGFHMVAPKDLWSFYKSSLFSLQGKARATFDLFLPRGNQSSAPESVAQFLTRRLGKEISQRAGEPLVGGIYTGDAGQLSAEAAIPYFVELERRHGSLIRGLNRERGRYTAGGARYSLFATLSMGLSGLVDALASSLQSERIMLGVPARQVVKTGENNWLIGREDGAQLEADGLIMALPARQAARLLTGVNRSLCDKLAAIESASSAVINFLFASSQIACPPDGFGFVVPASEGSNILAASFVSKKFANRAPQDMVMARIFIGGALAPQLLAKSDADLIDLALADLAKYIEVTGLPARSWLERWPESMPQYRLHHKERVAQIKEQVRELEGLALAGNCYDGVGIPDCVYSAEQAVKVVLDSLNGRGLI